MFSELISSFYSRKKIAKINIQNGQFKLWKAK